MRRCGNCCSWVQNGQIGPNRYGRCELRASWISHHEWKVCPKWLPAAALPWYRRLANKARKVIYGML